MRVLLIKPSSFGDVIHALPIATALARHPGVEAVDWVINREYASLLKNNPYVRKVIVFPRKEWGIGTLRNFLSQLREDFYEWVIDLQGLLRSGLIAAAARGYRKIGMSDCREGAGFFYQEKAPITSGHAIARYRQVLNFLGVACDTLEFPLPKGTETMKNVPESFVLVHPFSRWPTKVLPKDLVSSLARRLAPQKLVVVGQGEPFHIAETLDLTNQTNFEQLLDLMRRAQAVISSDSGPMHVAAALGKPLIALFGPTSPEKTGPWTTNSRVLQLDLSCIPCFSRNCQIAETQACLRRITVENVLQALGDVVSG
ncbi:MAG: glycosyltransferase family 9 protein [Verrucomicrobiae bacterium]|nr:glycosyltransferase family 9 protein [Verrucomicrobiae bacterium]